MSSQTIPLSEFKSVIINDWYPKKPEYQIRQSFAEIHAKFGTNKNSWHLQSFEICDLFRDHGKPRIFSIEDYTQYLEEYSKDD